MFVQGQPACSVQHNNTVTHDKRCKRIIKNRNYIEKMSSSGGKKFPKNVFKEKLKGGK